ncbi:MAG TPA: DNA-processing protein DprA [Jatrophihabitans sp.]
MSARTRLSAVADDVLLARAYLSRVGEPCHIGLWNFVRSAGPVAAMEAIRSAMAPVEVQRAVATRAAVADPYADLEVAERLGIRLVVPESDEWPHFALAALEHAGAERLGRYEAGERAQSEQGEPIPPLALWVRGAGETTALAVRSVAFVGSRASTSYGEHVATEWSYELASQDVTVISGGAFGIDAASHRGALAANGVSILVTAAGPDRPYPASNARLYDRVAANGLVISESPPGASPQKQRFLSRNRLIAAFSTGTVVVEAARRSGALNTAGHCTRLGRPLMAVPGPVTSATSRGCHDLLRWETTPAKLVGSAQDVLAVVGAAGEGLREPREPAQDDRAAMIEGLDPVVRRVLEGLPARRFAGPDEIAVRSGVEALEVIRALPVLQLAGLAESSEAGHRVAR